MQCVMPFFVATPMTPFRRSNFWVADAIQFIRSAVATIGVKKFTYGNVSHEIQVCDPYPLPPRTDSQSHPSLSLSLSLLSLLLPLNFFSPPSL